jgi:hypothetical protein
MEIVSYLLSQLLVWNEHRNSKRQKEKKNYSLSNSRHKTHMCYALAMLIQIQYTVNKSG